MLQSKDERNVNEFCANGNLEDFRQIVISIFKEINVAGCKISARYDEPSSSHQAAVEKCRIQITLQPIYEEPIEIIWTILHEFGHHLSGEVNKIEILDFSKKIERERLAWRIARTKAIEYPLLARQIKAFDKYAEKCVESYLNAKKNDC